MSAAENGGDGGNEDPSTLLAVSIREGRIDVLCSILGRLKDRPDYQKLIDGPIADAPSLLHLAVQIDSVDAVRSLLSFNASAAVTDDNGRHPLQLAKSEAVRNAFVQEALRAVTTENIGRLCQILASGLPVDAVDSAESQNSLLSWAADFASVNVVRVLLESGATVNFPNTKGETPLHGAIKRGDESVVRELLDHGADAGARNAKGEDSFEMAERLKRHNLTSLLNQNTVQRRVQRSESVESLEADRMSLISMESVSASLFDRTSSYPEGKLERWTDLLWPQPRQFRELEPDVAPFAFPLDGRLKVYFDDASTGCPRQIMQAIQVSASLIAPIGLSVEYRGHTTSEHEKLPGDGRLTCGVFPEGRPSGSYSLQVDGRGVELFAEDYAGIRYGFATLVQVLRIHRAPFCKSSSPQVVSLPATGTRPSISAPSWTPKTLQNGGAEDGANSTTDLEALAAIGIHGAGHSVPALAVKDEPQQSMRAIYLDFSGCKILNAETLLQLATRLSYCKANYLFVNFEVRTTDRYQLPYTNRDLFHMSQVCEELFIKLVPSLDLQSNYVEPMAARATIENFLDDFPRSREVHFGPNIASILAANRPLLDAVQRRASARIFLSLEPDEKNASLLNQLPPFVTLCLEGRYPFHAEKFLSPRLSLVLKFSSSDEGYLCPAPESTAKKAILAQKLATRANILGAIVCDQSFGCEAMPASLAYSAQLAAIGVGWNGAVDMRKWTFLLARLTAQHVLLDGDMTALFEQAATLGRVEHELTRFSIGQLQRKSHSNLTQTDSEIEILGYGGGGPVGTKNVISVFVEIILNPEGLTLDRLTAAIFKRARIELRRSLHALDEARRRLPYNYELALVLAEIQLVTELMVLACRLGQAMCVHGSVAKTSTSSLANGLAVAQGGRRRFGVGQLPQTQRTDFANSLLEIRSKFQSTWLSRSIPSTLPNALKMFDNLFKALLPPDLQDYGRQLL